MQKTLLYPFEVVLPSQLLSQYSEWVYFGLILIFFISISGLTLRKHFNRPYVKPLIISVGLMLTVGVFMTRRYLPIIFESWGLLGLILMVFIVSTIPFGLCKGFGMPGKRAAYLTYVLLYLLAWYKFPEFFFGLADSGLGLVNLALVILFFFAVYQSIPFRISKDLQPANIPVRSPFKTEIEKNLSEAKKETQLVKDQVQKNDKVDIRTISDIVEALAEIQRIVEMNGNNLSRENRQRISLLIKGLANSELIQGSGSLSQDLFFDIPSGSALLERLKLMHLNG